MKKLLFLMLAVLFTVQGWGQTFLNENFNGGSMPSTFTLVNGACGWVVTQNGSSAWWSLPAGNGYYTIINDDDCGSEADNSNVWMKLPSLDLSSVTTLSMNFNSCLSNAYGGIALVKVSTNGGTTWTDHAVPSGNGAVWEPLTIDLTSYCGNANVIVAFYYNDENYWAFGWAVDDIVIAAPLANDLTAVSLLPDNMFTGQAQVPYFKFKNNGLTAVTASDYTIQLTDGGSYTQNISGVDLATGQDTTIVFPVYTATTAGAMTLTATITYTADLYTADNTITATGQVYDMPDYPANAYTLNASTGTYYSFDVFTSALTSAGSGISTSPYPTSETWVGTGNTGQGDGKIARILADGSFGYVLPDGAFVKIGNLTSPVEATPLSIAYNKIDGNLYVIGYIWEAQVVNYLGTINLETLEVTPIGSDTNANTMIIMGMDFDENGNLYAIGEGPNNLYQISTTDGSISLVGSLGLNIINYYYLDLAYDLATQKFYSYITLGDGSYKYGSIDKTTGAFTEIAPIAIPGQYACITIISNTLPTCDQVTGVTASEITATTAIVSWLAPENIPANGYEYYLSTSATAPSADSIATGTTNDTVVYLQDLTPNTAYYMWVRSNCGSDVSAWSNFPAAFTTLCEAISTFPWLENFDSYGTGYGVFPSCWERYNNGAVSTTNPYIISGQNHSAPGAIYFSNSNSLTLVSPLFDVDINNLGLKFWLRREGNSSGTFSVGYLATPADPTSFVALTTYDDANETWIEHQINLGGTPAGIKQFAFRQNQIYDSWYYWLDDITVSDCVAPDNIALSHLNATSANIVWTDLASINSWTLKVSSAPLTDPTTETGGAFDGTVADTAWQLVSGLSPETTYYVYLRNSCDTTWATYSFTTIATCPLPTNLTANSTSTTIATLTWDAWDMTGWNLKVSTTALTDLDNETGGIFDGPVTGTPSQTLTNLILDTTYHWYVQSDCGGAWATASFTPTYCYPAPTSIDGGAGIVHVTFGLSPIVDYATTPPGTAPYYNNNSAQIGGIYEGMNSFPLTITRGSGYHYIAKAWIDWNNDLVFDPVTELVGGPSNDATGDVIFTVAVPQNQPLGSYRLRIGTIDYGDPTPCYSGSYGSYEDYTLQIAPEPACTFPINLAAIDLTASSATATWIAPTPAPANGYQVLVSTSNIEPTGDEPEIQAIIDTFFTIGNLNPVILYYVWVRSDCGGEDYSPWMFVNFTTPCAATSIPYTQNFEANTDIPSCWTTFGAFYVVYDYTTSSNTLRFNGNETNVALLPVFDVDVNTTQLSFVLRRESINENTSGPMDIGYLTNIADANSFVPVMTDILAVAAINTPFAITLSAFPAGITNIAFRQTTANNFWYWLDDISVLDASCLPISVFAIENLTATSVDVTWIDNFSPSTSWNVEVYSTAQQDPTIGGGNIYTEEVYDTVVYLTDLTPNTTYYVYVKNDCGWSNYTFTTPCLAATIPYTENFDANTNLPACWKLFGAFYVVSDYSTSSPNTLKFNGSGTNVAMLPVFDVDVNTAQLGFVLRRESSDFSGPMDIGYLTDMSDANSFVPVMTNILTVIDANTPFSIALSEFPAGIKNIAFRQTASLYSSYWYWMDDVSVFDANCLPVSALSAENLTATSADVTWIDNGSSSTSWNVEIYATAQLNPAVGGGNVYTTTVSDTVAQLTDLTPNTTYYVYIKNDCGWSNYSFTTPCALAALPYTENFDANTNLPACWTMFGSFAVVVANATSFPNTLRFNGYGTNVAVLPIFDAAVNTARLSFVLTRESDYYSGTMDIGYLTDILDANSFVAVMTDILTVSTTNTPLDTSLSAFPAGVTNIAFRQTATYGYWYWLDDVNVYAAPISCPAPTNVEVSAVTATSATVSWTPGGEETEWLVTWVADTTDIDDWNNVVTTAIPYTIMDLTAGIDYWVTVSAICGASDTSYRSSPANFTTLACSEPDNVQITGSTANTITLTWQPVNGETKWNIIWRSVAGSGSAIVENTPTYTLIELVSSTTYEVCVVAICGEGSESPEECISATTAIHDGVLATTLQLYPNPTTGELRITNYELREGDKIEVYNILGQPQSFSILDSQFSIIDVSHLSAGIYTVKIGGYIGKFVKR